MSYEIWCTTHPKTELKTTQLQGLVNDLTEQEQEIISGCGESGDAWLNEFSIRIENQQSQKKWLGSNFRVTTEDF